MLVPLYGFLKGDVMGLMVLIHDHERVVDIGARLMEAASIRIAPKARAQIYVNGRLLDPDLTIAEAGLRGLDRVDVVGVDG